MNVLPLPTRRVATAPAAPSLVAVSAGVDSLYLSVQGTLKDGVAEAFGSLRALAEDGDDGVVPFDMGEDMGLYLLRPQRWRRYPIWLTSPRWELMLGASPPLPVAYVQVHAAFLHLVGVEEAVQRVIRGVRDFVVAADMTVSRIDVYADTQGWTPPDDIDRYVCRARKRDGFYDVPAQEHAEGRRLTGLRFGRGEMLARIYDKTCELRSRDETWPQVIWQDADPAQPVWRVEFQVRHGKLKERGLHRLTDVLARRDALWEYATEWLSLRVPTGAQMRCNWPVAPEWDALRNVAIGYPSSPLVRERVHQASELRVLRGLGGYLSALAALGDDDDELGGVWERAMPMLRRYYARQGTDFASVVQAKRARRVPL